MYIETNRINNYNEFEDYMSKVLTSIKSSIEQVIQFDSKYFKADTNLFKYDINLLSNSNNPDITKKVYVIVKNNEDIQKERYKKYISPYKRNGFEVKNIYLCDMETKNKIDLDDLILIDNYLCITAETDDKKQNNLQNKEITIYHINDINFNEKKIKKARNLLKTLRIEAFRQHNASKIFEPLSESADINFQLALNNCHNGIMSNGNCKWYHSVWQYLRIIDKVSSPEWHATFYENCFDKLVNEKENPQILISGTADYSLLAYVYNSIKKYRKEAKIYVLDTCTTPLKICDWYAKKQNFNIYILNMNVFDLPQLELNFDLICSDAFLTRFSKVDAESVVSTWYNSLNYDGMIVTTVRSRNNDNEFENKYQKKKYVKDCIDRFQKWEGYFNISLKDFEKMVQAYINKMTSNNLGNRKSIIEIFEKTGFIMDDLTNISDTPGELGETAYCEICCIKKEK